MRNEDLFKKSEAGETEPYWEAAQEERLVFQRCDDCDEPIFPPRLVCPYCMSYDLTWEESSGDGTVYSFSTIHHPAFEAWEDAVPYTLGFIELEEGFYLFSQIVNCDYEDIEVDMPVSVVFDHVTEDVTLPKFEPR